MTNEQKIKAYLDAGHWVKVNLDIIWWYVTIVNYDMAKFIYSDWSSDLCSKFESYIVEPIPRKPPYKFWDKVVVLEIAREMDWYDDFSDTKKWTVWKVWTITWICSDWTYIINSEAFFPSWAIAPAFDDENDERRTKIQELETQLAKIAKELELLKK